MRKALQEKNPSRMVDCRLHHPDKSQNRVSEITDVKTRDDGPKIILNKPKTWKPAEMKTLGCSVLGLYRVKNRSGGSRQIWCELTGARLVIDLIMTFIRLLEAARSALQQSPKISRESRFGHGSGSQGERVMMTSNHACDGNERRKRLSLANLHALMRTTSDQHG